VLSAIARAYADDQRPKEVLVLSNTHQAVNNALNKIREQGMICIYQDWGTS